MSQRVDITKDEFDRLLAEHAAKDRAAPHFVHANSIYVYRDEPYLVRQTWAHEKWGLPSIEELYDATGPVRWRKIVRGPDAS